MFEGADRPHGRPGAGRLPRGARLRGVRRGRGGRRPGRLQLMGTSAAIDVAALRADFPILSRRCQRRAARLPRLGRDLAEAGGGAGRDGRLLPRDQRQRAPGRLRARRRGDGPLRGRPRLGGAAGERAARRHDLHQERQRGDQPGRLGVGRARAGRRRRDPRHRDGAPLQHRPVADRRRDHGRARCASSPVTPEGELDMEALRELLSERTRMVAVVHASNVLGTINPVAEIARARARAGRPRAGGRLAERPPHAGRRRRRSAATSWPSPGHKMLGPTGIGVLVGRLDVLERMEPFLGRRRDDLRRHAPRAPRGTTCRGSSRPARRRSPRPWASARPPTTWPASASTRSAPTRSSWSTHMLAALGEVEGITIYGPRDPRSRGRRGLVQPAGPPPARHRPARRPRGRLRPGRPPLRQAAHAACSAWAPRPARAPTSTIPTTRSTCSCAPWAPRERPST